ncbi:hypothetical protein [Micromonospora sp. NPDC093277]|uniref:hypothetical protein n=1 Tax=Micromonospora sp. NPDC093277 TaxID=3364291 RepID=UPI0037F3FECD
MTDTRPAVDRLLDLLPGHVVARDVEAGGLLRTLLEAVGGELAILEQDIDDLYASWFIETCPEWVVPYLGDLVGVTDLPPDLSGVGGAGLSRRAFVANTLAYRRRKGTLAVIEQVARDVTGWPARAVEYYRLLAASSHVNHVRLDRAATASIRTPTAAGGSLELVPTAVARGALDPLAHTADVRGIARLRGRYGIGNVGVFLFPDQVYESGWSPARARGADASDGWSVHPLRLDGPLYAVPETEETIEHLASEADLPVPLRPRRLLAMLAAARAADADPGSLPVVVRVDDGDPLGPQRMRVYGLEGLATDPASPDPDDPDPLPGWQVVVDTLTGRVYPYRSGVADIPQRLDVRFGYGATADVGAGTYDRAAVHADVLAADVYVGDPGRGGPGVTAQVAVTAGPPGTVPSPLATALSDAEAAWAGASSPAGGTYVIAIGDSGSYHGDVEVHVPEGTRLVVVAASWAPRFLADGEVLPPPPGVYTPEGLRPQLVGTVTVTGEGGGSLVLDGLVVEGDVVVGPGALGSLALSQCTVSGTVGVGTGAPANAGIAVQIVRSVVGGVAFGPAAATLVVADSVVDAAVLGRLGDGGGVDPGADAIRGTGLALTVDASTVRGVVTVRTLEATNSILDGPVDVEHRQAGCARYSFLPAGARAPRRYRCVPAPGGDASVRPVYRSIDPGSPHYLALAAGCPVAVGEGGEGGAEMGVHHHLRRPVRVRAAVRLLAPYLPVGLEIGVAAPAATAGS